MLHKRWKDYTEKEITAIARERCYKCKYNSHSSGSTDSDPSYKSMICLYIEHTGHMRGVRPDECEHYKDKH